MNSNNATKKNAKKYTHTHTHAHTRKKICEENWQLSRRRPLNRHIKINYRLLILFVDAVRKKKKKPGAKIQTDANTIRKPGLKTHSLAQYERKRSQKVCPALLIYTVVRGVRRYECEYIFQWQYARSILGRRQEADNQAKWYAEWDYPRAKATEAATAATAVRTASLNFMAALISPNERYLAGAFSINNWTIRANFTNFLEI